MSATRPLARMKALLTVREAVSTSDRFVLAERSAALANAETLEAVAAETRDEGLTFWQSGLSGRAFDPSLVRFAANWLLASETGLAAARLDTSIAESRRGEAAACLEQSQGSEAAAAKIFHRTRKKQDKKRDERQSADLADMFLGSWNR